MAETTYYGIELLEEGAQDWVSVLNRALSALTEQVTRQQRPSATTLYWGEISGAKYLLCDASGVKCVGGLNTALYPTRNFVVEGDSAFPAEFADGSLFVRSDEGILYARLDGAWVALGQVSTESIAAAGGVLVSDMGVPKGSFGISNGIGAITNMAPGADLTLLTSDSTSETGWVMSTWIGLGGHALSKGNILVGLDGNEATAFAPGADGEFMIANSAAPEGVGWSSLPALLGALLANRGEIVSGGPTGPVVTAAAAASGYVLTSNTVADGGVAWTPQSELGSLPGTRTRVAGDIFLATNYL